MDSVTRREHRVEDNTVTDAISELLRRSLDLLRVTAELVPQVRCAIHHPAARLLPQDLRRGRRQPDPTSGTGGAYRKCAPIR